MNKLSNHTGKEVIVRGGTRLVCRNGELGPPNKKLQLWTVCTRGYEGAKPQPCFTMEVLNQMDAERKASKWAQHHGFTHYTDAVNCKRSDVMVRPAQGIELLWTIHNEYVN